MKMMYRLFALLALLGLLAAACSPSNQSSRVSYSLKSTVLDGKLVYVGQGGDIEGQVDPILKANVGDVVTVNLTSGDGANHNIAFPDFNVHSEDVAGQGASTAITFGVDKTGSFPYYDELPGHRAAGMSGILQVGGTGAVATSAYAASQPQATPMGMTMPEDPAPVTNNAPQAPANNGADIVRDPTDLPGPIGNRAPTTMRIDLEAKEVIGQLAEGTTFAYWTFNGKVPGPFYRVRVGDTVEVHFKNDAASLMPHSVDFHAVTGPGGGAVMSNTAPGAETTFTFKALNPGLYVYHCATPPVAMHIANGMYGLILVEPEGGLPPVDREFYVMQGEIYTTGKYGDLGAQGADANKLMDEKPEYFVFNGAVGALSKQKPLKANVGETVRIFFGDGGPNFTSSFHVIGEIFDRLYNLGSVTTPPMTDVQTTTVPPGGATIAEFQLQVPGNYILVDHALSRVLRGVGGVLMVEGAPVPEIYDGTPQPGSGH
jgi:nitrite reductase (NO-forming)